MTNGTGSTLGIRLNEKLENSDIRKNAEFEKIIGMHQGQNGTMLGNTYNNGETRTKEVFLNCRS